MQRLSLKTQSLLTSFVTNLPTDIQFHILESEAIFRSFDLWSKYFEKLVTANNVYIYIYIFFFFFL